MRRGTAVESVHRGAVAAVDGRGVVVAACGDPDLRTFARSAIKPLQALPLVADGAVERFGLTPSEVAIACGSHSGEDVHVDAVRSILRKIDLDEAALQCGGHFPFHQPTAEAMRLRGEAPRAVHDNCSGKHAGMLALARGHGWAVDGYLAPEHPVQRRIVEALLALTGSPTAVVTAAVDGCGAPTFHISLRELATAFARLADPSPLAAPWQTAAPVVTDAMMRFPEMVAGTGRSNTVLMRAAAGRLFIKDGGEAIVAAGVP
ncbi:MAG: asparaginase, partial [Armatimonadetes bacterium]|nr:asparaginase [Armatimonadota bacterium]